MLEGWTDGSTGSGNWLDCPPLLRWLLVEVSFDSIGVHSDGLVKRYPHYMEAVHLHLQNGIVFGVRMVKRYWGGGGGGWILLV